MYIPPYYRLLEGLKVVFRAVIPTFELYVLGCRMNGAERDGESEVRETNREVLTEEDISDGEGGTSSDQQGPRDIIKVKVLEYFKTETNDFSFTVEVRCFSVTMVTVSLPRQRVGGGERWETGDVSAYI